MMRVAPVGVVSFPNFAHWRLRAALALRGRMPNSLALPQSWDETPNIHPCTLADFESLAAALDLRVSERVLLGPDRGPGRRAPPLRPNLLAAAAVYRLARTGRPPFPRRGGVTLRRSSPCARSASPPSPSWGLLRSSRPPPPAPPTPIKVSEKEFSITGVPKTLKHGVKYTFTLTNKGKFPHDMLFDGKKVDDVGVHNKDAVAPGKTASFSVTFPAAGTYQLLLRHQGPRRQGHEGQRQGHLSPGAADFATRSPARAVPVRRRASPT